MPQGLAGKQDQFYSVDADFVAEAGKHYVIDLTNDVLMTLPDVPASGIAQVTYNVRVVGGFLGFDPGTAQINVEAVRPSIISSLSGDVYWNGIRWVVRSPESQVSQSIGRQVLQPAHGFAEGEQVYYESATGLWTPAQADDYTTLKMGQVHAPTLNAFWLLTYGQAQWSHGLAEGTYYLSDQDAGQFIGPDTPPTDSGTFQQAAFETQGTDWIKVLDQTVWSI